MGHGTYILDGHKVVKCDDVSLWAKSLGVLDSRRVAKDDRNGKTVSTVFLAMDHSHTEGDEHPVLFETMIFNGEDGDDEYCMRYETWEEAEDGHLAACVIAFGHKDEATKKKLEWRDKVVFDRTLDELVDKMLDEDE